MITKMSGLWTDYKITTVEDQQKVACPLNEITETLDYNLRVLIDSHLYNKDAEVRAWKVSKTKRISPNGIVVATFAQENYNQHTDYIERDENGKVIGMWADFYRNTVSPQDSYEEPTLLSSIQPKITYSGNSQDIKIGGSKTFTVTFYEDDQPVDFIPGTWSFFIGNEDATDVIATTFPAENKARAKFTGGDDYIGQILTVRFTATFSGEEVTDSVDIGIIAL